MARNPNLNTRQKVAVLFGTPIALPPVRHPLDQGRLAGGTIMAPDQRDTLELLQEELNFIEQGGYGRSVRTPWLTKSIFQDSVSCLNYGYPYRAHPCSECRLLDFVAPEHRTEAVPCHYIALDEAGHTVEDLEAEDNEAKLERLVRDWLRERIHELDASQSSGEERPS